MINSKVTDFVQECYDSPKTMLNHQSKYIYLHGLVSSPQSIKAQKFKALFAAENIPLIIPDLNQDDFYHLTLTRQIQQVSTSLENDPTPVTLIGSSLGGLTAAFLAEKNEKVKQLILLAPAFSFFCHWLNNLDKNILKRFFPGIFRRLIRNFSPK